MTRKIFDSGLFQVYSEDDLRVFLMSNDEYSFQIGDLLCLVDYLQEEGFISLISRNLSSHRSGDHALDT